MAFSHHKISIGVGQTAGQAVSYLADPQAKSADYYSESKRAPMMWAASDRAKAELGLGDHVELWKVERLLNGQHPLSGELLRRYGPTQTMVGAIDVTESPAPKSVSILWAMASPELKAKIEGMVVGAVAGAVAVMTHHVPLVRERYGPGPKDVRAIKANDVVGLEVLHTTARISESKAGIPDPQLHVHALLFADLREDGRLRAIDSRLVLQHQTELDGEAQAALAWKLERAGFEIERTPVLAPNGKVKRIAWEIKGIPHSLIEAMSGRSKEISDLARQYREETHREAAGPGWDRFVASRRGAKATASAEELQAIWAAEAETHGYGPQQAQQLAGEAAVRAQQWTERGEDSTEAEQLRQEILRDLCRDHALVPERQLHALAQQRAIGLVKPYLAGRIVAKLFGEGDLLRTSEGQVTTLEVLAHEQRAERALRRLVDSEPEAAVEQERLEQEYRQAEDEGRPFDPEQREAIALALSGARFVSIAGPAGTGKGYASRAMVNLWREQGRRTFALAVAGRTAQQAGADSGATPITLNGLQARTEHGVLQLKRSDVLLVDEAAMVDHHRYADLLETAARAGATVVQVGDDHQLNPVGPGGLWTVFHALAEEQGTATALRQVHRARNPAEAQAWTDLREGRIEEALTWYRDAGQLRLYDRRPELLQGMVADWWQGNREGVMVVDTSNSERDSLNRMAQAKRLEAAELGQDAFELGNGREIRVGDRVLFSEHPTYLDLKLNAPGPRIENGTGATVLDLIPAPTAEAAGSNRVASLELHEPTGSRVVQVDSSASLELGYARHTLKSQGMTAPAADIGLSAHTGQQELYEMASRSVEGTRIHALRAEVEGLDVDVKELEAARVEVHPEPQLEEMTLGPPEPERASLRMFNEAQLRPGQVVTFAEPLPLREPSGVELGEMGVVRSIHPGGITFDFAQVELVGGREVRVYQTDLVEPAPAEVGAEAVFDQPARPEQRDPCSLSNLPLTNGAIIQRGDLVRFAEADTQGRVVEVARHSENRAYVELEQTGERVPVVATSNLEVLKTGHQIAVERARQVEQATIRDIQTQVSRSEPKRAIADAKIEPSREAETTTLVAEDAREQIRQPVDNTRTGELSRDLRRLSEPQSEPEAMTEEAQQPAPERLREAAQEAGREPATQPQVEPEAQHLAAEAEQQAQQRAMDHSAGRVAAEHSAEHVAEHSAAELEGASR